ncbi:MAG: glycosyltransferase [Paludibacter sp.]|nr:glycosyltransferase [Paludibacter sp.]
MIKKIVLLNTAHKSLDDRVFYHQAQSLINQGYDVEIISTKENLTKNINSIQINSFEDKFLNKNQRINEIIKYLSNSNPQIIIADSPLAVISSSIYKRNKNIKLIYDITEWYPSKKNLTHNKGINKFFKTIFLTLLNLISGFKSDCFIFGEHFKSVPFRLLFFWKKYIFLPYYPDLNFINYFPVERIKSAVNLTFSGIISEEKGIESVIKSIKYAALKSPGCTFNLRIIGYFPTNEDRNFFEYKTKELPQNIIIYLENFLAFPEYCKIIGNTHIFLDLRKKDIENSLCLPIKLFYYLACGRPVIYSNLSSIKKAIPNIDFGFTCLPNDYESISYHITEYINNPKLYNTHCYNALRISKNKFNWKLIENDFINFIK